MIRESQLCRAWPKKSLSEVAEFLDNRRKPVKASERHEGKYPYYGANGQQGTINNYIFDEPLVLLAEDGGHFGEPEKSIAYTISGRTWVNNHAHVLRPVNGTDLQYLFRHLQHYDLTKYINGTTREKLTKSQAESIIIAVPSLAEQRRIAAILDKADAIRRKHEQALALADDFLRSTFLHMFGDPVTNPIGWPVGTLRDLIKEVKYGTAQKAYSTGKYPILRMGNITYQGGWDLTDLKYIDLSGADRQAYLVQFDDILFNRTNSKDLVGKTAVFDQREEYIFAGYLVRARVNDRADPYYISAYLNSRHGKETLRSMCKSIIGMANINAQEFLNLSIALPEIETQKEFRRKVEAVKSTCDSHRQAHIMANGLFLSLSQRAFRGEL